MTAATASLSAFSSELLNSAVNDSWLGGLPSEMAEDWAYVDTMAGERGVDNGRARLILQRKQDYALFALPFYEPEGEVDLYADRFRGEAPEFIPVIPYTKIVRSTDYKPVDPAQPLTGAVSVHVHPHID